MVYIIVRGDGLENSYMANFATVALGQQEASRAHKHGLLVELAHIHPGFGSRVSVVPGDVYVGQVTPRHRLVFLRRWGGSAPPFLIRTHMYARG